MEYTSVQETKYVYRTVRTFINNKLIYFRTFIVLKKTKYKKNDSQTF